MNYVSYFTGNHILNCAFVAWFTAQFLKVVIVYIKKHKLDVTRFVGSGGMPSSHSACVTAMTIAVGKVCGIYTAEFAIALTVACIVMYDATGVRRAAGEQAKIINYMMEHWNDGPESFQKQLKELVGHTPVEVFAGAVLGLIIGFIF